MTRLLATFALWMLSTSFISSDEELSIAKTETTMNNHKMKVEIWSDIMCPFCYIGKRHFEAALAQFPEREYIEIVWKSFQLDPSIPENIDKNTSVFQYLAESKGISLAQSEQMHQRVIQMAKNAGLDYNFDIAVVANSFKAHRVIQLAKNKSLGDALEERLFKAYFTEGKDFGNPETLSALGQEIGLTKEEVTEALTNETYANLVKQDINEARSLGLTGVPFFVFDRKYGVSGAQPTEAFTETLTQAFAEWRKQNPETILNIKEGPSCTPEGVCE